MSLPPKVLAQTLDSVAISEIEKRELLAVARRGIVELVTYGRHWRAEMPSPVLALRRGAFVTLAVRGRLRGCVGMTSAKDPLAYVIAHCAVSAASEDRRFKRLQRDEIAHLTIEISILSPLQPITPGEIEIGRHGLAVECGPFRGLLLPKVAVEHRWTREQFLAQTCEKAGLPISAWKSPETRLLGFTTDVFAEEVDATARS
jgi:uncharacterized protein